jgi:hypothetical protein
MLAVIVITKVLVPFRSLLAGWGWNDMKMNYLFVNVTVRLEAFLSVYQLS